MSIPRKESNAMKGHSTSTAIPSHALKIEALASMSASFEAFCLASGIEALSQMMADDAQTACGRRHVRGPNRQAHRWGKTKGKIGFRGGMIEIERPRLRGFDSKERALPSWEAALAEDWLGKWAMNQMLINVSTRKFKRSVRLPEGDVASPAGSGLSKSAVSRRFVALSTAHMKKWLASDLSGLDLLVIQIDGIHMDEDMTLVAAIGVDAKGDKHPLGLVEGATESAATVQALVENLIERGVDPAVPSSALQPDFRILWKTSIFHRIAYHSSLSMASRRDWTGSSVINFHSIFFLFFGVSRGSVRTPALPRIQRATHEGCIHPF